MTGRADQPRSARRMSQITIDDRESTPSEGGGRERLPELGAKRTSARGLAWFSVGLGLAQIFAPRAMVHKIGLAANRRTERVMMACGLRELACGMGLFAGGKSSTWLWLRVGGDLLDLALLGTAKPADDDDGAAKKRRMALAAVGSALMVDAIAARHHSTGAEAPRLERLEKRDDDYGAQA